MALAGGQAATLAGELSKVKSLTTVNTSPLPQAVAGGILLDNHCSLQPVVRDKLPFYRANSDRMLRRLAAQLSGVASAPREVSSSPSSCPSLSMQAVSRSAPRDFGVICCPMTFFSLIAGRERQVRLSFSYVSPEQIDEGIARFARFVRSRPAEEPAAPHPARQTVA